MAKIELKGTLIAVGSVEYVGEKRMAKQNVVLEVPAYTDEFGDRKGNDEKWLLEVIGDNVGILGLAPNTVGKKAKCTVFVESRFVDLPADGKKEAKQFYQISAKLWKIEFKPVS